MQGITQLFEPKACHFYKSALCYDSVLGKEQRKIVLMFDSLNLNIPDQNMTAVLALEPFQWCVVQFYILLFIIPCLRCGFIVILCTHNNYRTRRERVLTTLLIFEHTCVPKLIRRFHDKTLPRTHDGINDLINNMCTCMCVYQTFVVLCVFRNYCTLIRPTYM